MLSSWYKLVRAPCRGASRDSKRASACKAMLAKAEAAWLREDEMAIARGEQVLPRHALMVTETGWCCEVCGLRHDGKLRGVPPECFGPGGPDPLRIFPS